MNDQRLEHLLRMSGEIDELERQSLQTPIIEQPAFRIVAGDTFRPAFQPNRRSIWRFLATSAIAASLAVAGIVGWRALTTPAASTRSQDSSLALDPGTTRSNPIEPLPDPRIALTSDTPAAPVDRDFDPRRLIAEALPHLQQLLSDEHFAAAQRAMLLVIYRGADDRCLCVEPVERRLAVGEDLSDVTRSELISAALKVRCDQNPDRVVVFGLAGPAEQLPESHSQAAQFASCILVPTEPSRDLDPMEFAAAAAACLPSDVRIVAETISIASAR